MPKDDKRAPTTALAWFQELPDGNDPSDLRNQIRPEHRTQMIVRFHSSAPHGGHHQWLELLREAKKAEPHKFFAGPTSPDADAERFEKMTAAELLAEANKFGGRK